MRPIKNKHTPMKQCIRCSNMLAENATYCNVCNSPQTEGFEQFEIKEKPNSVFLIILCSLTIIGSLISLISLPFSMNASEQLGIEFSTSVMIGSAFLAVLSLAGAILMLLKKIIGLYIYTASAVGSIVMSVYSAFTVIVPNMPTGVNYISMAFGIFFTVLFVVLYWLPINRRLLS